MKWHALVLSIFLALAGCQSANKDLTKDDSTGGKRSSSAPNPGMTAGLASHSLGQPIEVGNITILPVCANEDVTRVQQHDDYLTLMDATKLGVIEVSEMPNEIVSKLLARNIGSRAILLVGGDLLVGGKQDRIVAHDVVVPPGKIVEVDVFCVEQGRWSGYAKSFKSGGATAPMSVKIAAVADRDQSLVWESVGKVNRAHGVGSGITTLKAGIDLFSSRPEKDGYLSAVEQGLAKHKNVVGLLVLRDGVVVALEMFGSPQLFGASKRNLTLGLIAEVEPAPSVRPKSPSPRVLAGFVAEALTRNGRAVAGERRRSENLVEGVELHADATKSKGAPVFVHGTYVPRK